MMICSTWAAYIWRVPHTAAYYGGFDNLLGQVRERWGQWDIFSNWRSYSGRWWLVSIYQLQANPVELLGFVHVECLGDATCENEGHGGIGVAYYKEGTNTVFIGAADSIPRAFRLSWRPFKLWSPIVRAS